MPRSLTERDHNDMDALLSQVLDDFKAGTITKEQAVGGLAHVMAAQDIGNTGEARAWFANPQYVRDGA